MSATFTVHVTFSEEPGVSHAADVCAADTVEGVARRAAKAFGLSVDDSAIRIYHEGCELDPSVNVVKTALVEGSEIEARPSKRFEARKVLTDLGLLWSMLDARTLISSRDEWSDAEKAGLVQLMLDANETPSARLPLPPAAREGYLETVKVLLPHASRGAKTEALVAATLSRHFEVAKYLITCGADTLDGDGNSELLHSMARRGCLPLVEYLTAHGADVSKVSAGVTPLYNACRDETECGVTVAACLVDHGADVNQALACGSIPLHAAVRQRNIALVEYLVAQGSDVSKAGQDGRTPLHIACNKGSLLVAECLVAGGAEVDKQDNGGQGPLHVAACKDHIGGAELLVEHDADVNLADATGKTPLYLAAQTGHCEVIKHLAACKGLKIDKVASNGWTPLHEAASYGRIEVIKQLVRQKAAVDAVDPLGKMPLHIAACHGHVRVVQYLVRGDTVNRAANGGYTPLHFAAITGHSGVIQCLVNSGADINATSMKGTALHIASGNGYLGIVTFLTTNGARTDVAGKGGATPLHEAARNGHLNVVEHLVEKGASVDAEDEEGVTPAQAAHPRVAKYFAIPAS